MKSQYRARRSGSWRWPRRPSDPGSRRLSSARWAEGSRWPCTSSAGTSGSASWAGAVSVAALLFYCVGGSGAVLGYSSRGAGRDHRIRRWARSHPWQVAAVPAGMMFFTDLVLRQVLTGQGFFSTIWTGLWHGAVVAAVVGVVGRSAGRGRSARSRTRGPLGPASSGPAGHPGRWHGRARDGRTRDGHAPRIPAGPSRGRDLRGHLLSAARRGVRAEVATAGGTHDQVGELVGRRHQRGRGRAGAGTTARRTPRRSAARDHRRRDLPAGDGPVEDRRSAARRANRNRCLNGVPEDRIKHRLRHQPDQDRPLAALLERGGEERVQVGPQRALVREGDLGRGAIEQRLGPRPPSTATSGRWSACPSRLAPRSRPRSPRVAVSCSSPWQPPGSPAGSPRCAGALGADPRPSCVRLYKSRRLGINSRRYVSNYREGTTMHVVIMGGTSGIGLATAESPGGRTAPTSPSPGVTRPGWPRSVPANAEAVDGTSPAEVDAFLAPDRPLRPPGPGVQLRDRPGSDRSATLGRPARSVRGQALRLPVRHRPCAGERLHHDGLRGLGPRGHAGTTARRRQRRHRANGLATRSRAGSGPGQRSVTGRHRDAVVVVPGRGGPQAQFCGG